MIRHVFALVRAMSHPGILAVAVALALTPPATNAAETVHVLLLQEAPDESALPRDNPISVRTFPEFARLLNSSEFKSRAEQYSSADFRFHHLGSTELDSGFANELATGQRSDRDLVEFVQRHPGLRIDAILLYAVYVRAVEAPNTRIPLLMVSMPYRILAAENGMMVGGGGAELAPDDNDIPPECMAPSAPRSCVLDFATKRVAALMADTTPRIALQLIAGVSGADRQP